MAEFVRQLRAEFLRQLKADFYQEGDPLTTDLCPEAILEAVFSQQLEADFEHELCIY